MKRGIVSDEIVTAQDGLRLHVREYGERASPGLAVVCLPGLARTTADFDPLAEALAGDPDRPRRVLAIDSRGRGLSEHDPDPANYSIPVELNDVLAVLTARAVSRAAFVGTSRGGLITMALAAARPTLIAGAVLNDIGPVLEPQGLMRIKSYVGKLPQPRSFEEGGDILRRLFSAQFPKLTAANWLSHAQRTWRDQAGTLVLTYDPRIANALADLDPANPVPTLWSQFDALGRVPVMVIRGANSDLLSPATVAAMQARHGNLTAIEIPDQGHAPLLSEPEIIARIAAFVVACEDAAKRAPAPKLAAP